jgi:hypothetical protein
MKYLTTAVAAGLTALAVTATAPALGGSGGEPTADKPGRTIEREQGPQPDDLVACLRAHGAQGVPAADDGAGRTLKQWIVEHQADAAARDALTACDVLFDDDKKDGAGEATECGPARATPARAARAHRRT